METGDNVRILARQVADVRELTFEELKLVAGGGSTTGNNRDCGNDWSMTFEEVCQGSDDNPCDMTIEVRD